MMQNQRAGRPLHEWALCSVGPSAEELHGEEAPRAQPVRERLGARAGKQQRPPGMMRRSHRHVRQIMTTDLFTVRADDLVDLAASVMDWEHVKSVPVEDDEGRFVGLLTHRALLRIVAHGGQENGSRMVVRDLMIADPVTVGPDTPTREAMRVMKEEQVGCLPVVEDHRLVGIVTESDLLVVASSLLERYL
jgi:CBS domain-containing protein